MPSVYQKYKTVARLQLFGDDDEYVSNSNSVYKLNSAFTNCKRLRFNFNGCMNDARLSKRARLIMEGCFLPTITNMNNYTTIRVVTSSEDKNFDSKKKNCGNPVLVAFKDPNTQVYNCTTEFYNISIPSNFLTNGYIELELESPVVTANIDFITSTPLNKFFLTCIIVDDDDEQTQDPNLAPPVDLKLYGRKGMPIRPPIT